MTNTNESTHTEPPIYRWKFLQTGLWSKHGDCQWTVGVWKKIAGKLEMCRAGYHCCPYIADAMSYAQGSVLARVEVRGKHLAEGDEECWQEMRLAAAYGWSEDESVRLALAVAWGVAAEGEPQLQQYLLSRIPHLEVLSNAIS